MINGYRVTKMQKRKIKNQDFSKSNITLWLTIKLRILTSSLVLCEYSKFRIEPNSYFSIRFDLKRTPIRIFEYLPSPISYLLISSRLTHYRQKYRLPVTLFNYRLSIYRVKHACAHAQHVFDLCCRSHQHQTSPSSLPAPHLCSGWGRGGDAYTLSKYVQWLQPAENEIVSQWHWR